MSQRVLPIQFLNLGVEMMYIIDQRLKAQSIPSENAQKVREDILNVMLSKRFVEEMFEAQPMYSKVALKSIFEKLANSSVMKMNDCSMDKLFELMIMSLKHQIVMVPMPRDLLWVTLNHLDALLDLTNTKSVQELIKSARNMFVKVYINLQLYDWLKIRRDLLYFVQGINTRVSVFLHYLIQDHFGQFNIDPTGVVPTGCEIPGTIRIFEENKPIASSVTKFSIGREYRNSYDVTLWVNIGAVRGVKLGTNLFGEELGNKKFEICSKVDEKLDDENFNQMDYLHESSSEVAKEEFRLLSMLIGSKTDNVVGAKNEIKHFKLNFLPDLKKENKSLDKKSTVEQAITIECGTRAENLKLEKMMESLNQLQPSEKDETVGDLFDLLEA